MALREARNLYAFEGVTQIGLGLDQQRPFRVTWLAGTRAAGRRRLHRHTAELTLQRRAHPGACGHRSTAADPAPVVGVVPVAGGPGPCPLFALLHRNAASPTAYFNLPTDRVVTLGTQVDL